MQANALCKRKSDLLIFTNSVYLFLIYGFSLTFMQDLSYILNTVFELVMLVFALPFLPILLFNALIIMAFAQVLAVLLTGQMLTA